MFEKTQFSENCNFCIHPLGRYYYLLPFSDKNVDIDSNFLDYRQNLWKDNLKFNINFEDFRTVAGLQIDENDITTHNEYCYLNGDDLCENLYRYCIGYPIRYGYWNELTYCSELNNIIWRFENFSTIYKRTQLKDDIKYIKIKIIEPVNNK